MNMSLWIRSVILLAAMTGCITKQTVTEHGRTVDEKIIIKRPIKYKIEKIKFE